MMHSGFVALVGRSNVGKSTLINRMVGETVSIVTRKPQTTRERILGIKTGDQGQMVLIDTPGIHQKTPHRLNVRMNQQARAAFGQADVIVWIIDTLSWRKDDEQLLKLILQQNKPVIVALNKVDQVKDKAQLLPRIEKLSAESKAKAVVPISALKGQNIKELEKVIYQYLPEGEYLFPADQISDKSEKFMAAEIIREKLMIHLGQELPFSVNVLIDEFKTEKSLLKIQATIIVNKLGQKAIVIGKNGEMLKKIGTAARIRLEKFFGKKVFLQLWVKVKENWVDRIDE